MCTEYTIGYYYIAYYEPALNDDPDVTLLYLSKGCPLKGEVPDAAW